MLFQQYFKTSVKENCVSAVLMKRRVIAIVPILQNLDVLYRSKVG